MPLTHNCGKVFEQRKPQMSDGPNLGFIMLCVMSAFANPFAAFRESYALHRFPPFFEGAHWAKKPFRGAFAALKLHYVSIRAETCRTTDPYKLIYIYIYDRGLQRSSIKMDGSVQKARAKGLWDPQVKGERRSPWNSNWHSDGS